MSQPSAVTRVLPSLSAAARLGAGFFIRCVVNVILLLWFFLSFIELCCQWTIGKLTGAVEYLDGVLERFDG